MTNRTSSRVLLIVAAFVLLLVPVAAIAGGGFTDVDDDNVFKNDIQWLADAGVTKGCNPPTNDRFCPEGNVTRQQMAAFMHRLAVNQVVDAGTVEGMTATELKGQTGESGPAGADGVDGDQGPQGDPGIFGLYILKTQSQETYVQCKVGDLATGAGWSPITPEEAAPVLHTLRPFVDLIDSVEPLGYYFKADKIINVYVICADLPFPTEAG